MQAQNLQRLIKGMHLRPLSTAIRMVAHYQSPVLLFYLHKTLRHLQLQHGQRSGYPFRLTFICSYS